MQILWTSWLSVVVLAMYFWNVVTVGKARGKYGIKAPSVEGPDEFLRALRVQANTVEQLVFFFRHCGYVRSGSAIKPQQSLV